MNTDTCDTLSCMQNYSQTICRFRIRHFQLCVCGVCAWSVCTECVWSGFFVLFCPRLLYKQCSSCNPAHSLSEACPNESEHARFSRWFCDQRTQFFVYGDLCILVTFLSGDHNFCTKTCCLKIDLKKNLYSEFSKPHVCCLSASHCTRASHGRSAEPQRFWEHKNQFIQCLNRSPRVLNLMEAPHGHPQSSLLQMRCTCASGQATSCGCSHGRGALGCTG